MTEISQGWILRANGEGAAEHEATMVLKTVSEQLTGQQADPVGGAGGGVVQGNGEGVHIAGAVRDETA